MLLPDGPNFRFLFEKLAENDADDADKDSSEKGGKEVIDGEIKIEYIGKPVSYVQHAGIDDNGEQPESDNLQQAGDTGDKWSDGCVYYTEYGGHQHYGLPSPDVYARNYQSCRVYGAGINNQADYQAGYESPLFFFGQFFRH